MKNLYFATILLSLCPIVNAMHIQNENFDEKMQEVDERNPLLPNLAAFNIPRSLHGSNLEDSAKVTIKNWIEKVQALQILLANNRNDIGIIKLIIAKLRKERDNIENQRIGHGDPQLMTRFNKTKEQFNKIIVSLIQQ